MLLVIFFVFLRINPYIMAEKEVKNHKIYYSIKEVAKMFDITDTTLRFWEKEFPTLRPKTTVNGTRQYREQDIEEVRVIHNLIKVRGFKISAAKKMLHANRSHSDKTAQIISTLTQCRDELMALKHQLDQLV